MRETLPSDPALDEVRNARRRISERVGHDPARLVQYYIEMQKQYKERLISNLLRPHSRGKSAA
jgi:hypothetical protein